ncbi:MAG: PorP/SprF family type IX secretion system membrane protein [Prevotellaceae bacterium]|jgi:type IX secretion system PorP/SprF family membrane protein|nr:PorP/SprF family type IX secretion system membrane protein [Prevotellaceae bacterium]
MKEKIKQVAFLLIFCLCLPSAKGQVVPRYGTYHIHGSLLNPAYTGYREYVYANAFYHRQWVQQTSTPGFAALAIDGSVSDAVNIGFQVTGEYMGLASMVTFAASYAYRIQLSRTSDLSFGLSLGAMYSGVSTGDEKAVMPEDPTLLELSGKAIPNISAGIYYGSREFYGGIAMRNLSGKSRSELEQATSFLLAPPGSIAATLGTFIPINERIFFRPSLMWQDNFETTSYIDATAAVIFYDKFWLGLSVRTDQPFGRTPTQGGVGEAYYSAAILGEAFVTDRITVSYAYDMGLSSFSSAYSGGHQVSIGYYLTQYKNTPYNYKYRFKSHYKSDICPNCITYGRPDRQKLR